MGRGGKGWRRGGKGRGRGGGSGGDTPRGEGFDQLHDSIMTKRPFISNEPFHAGLSVKRTAEGVEGRVSSKGSERKKMVGRRKVVGGKMWWGGGRWRTGGRWWG